MTRHRKVQLLKYLSAVLLAGAAAAYYAGSRDVFSLSELDRYHVLCDAFSLPGMFLLAVGMLTGLNNLGALDTLAYAVHYLAHTFLPVAFGEGKSYIDFIESRRENRTKGFGFLFVVGGVYFLIGVVFLILYLKAK